MHKRGSKPEFLSEGPSKNFSGTPVCPYCKAPAKRVREVTIRPTCKDKKSRVWVCSNHPACNSYVTINEDDPDQYVRLANRELRLMRRELHYWESVLIALHVYDYTTLYTEIKWTTGLVDPHASAMDEAMCQRVIDRLKEVTFNSAQYKRLPDEARPYFDPSNPSSEFTGRVKEKKIWVGKDKPANKKVCTGGSSNLKPPKSK